MYACTEAEAEAEAAGNRVMTAKSVIKAKGVIKRRCAHPLGCPKWPVWGAPSDRVPRYCLTHKRTSGMPIT